MLRKLKNRRRGQSTAEYAILIALVVAAVIAMQQYVKRSFQGRIADAAKYLISQTKDLGNTGQFEPGYLSTNFEVTRDSSEAELQDTNMVGTVGVTNISRASGGYQQFTYNGNLY